MAKKGTCGACFRLMSLTAAGKVVRHGWAEVGGKRRVGEYGNVIHTGPCFGAGWDPYEVSPECTKAFVERVLFPMGVGAKATIAHYASRPDLVFEGATFAANFASCRNLRLRSVSRWGGSTGGDWDGYFHWSVKVRPGDVEWKMKVSEEDWSGTKVPSYEVLHERMMREATASWEAIAKDGLHCCRKVETWTPAEVAEVKKTGPLVHGVHPGRSVSACGRRLRNIYGGATLRVAKTPEEITCPKCRAAMAA